jgi:hypothetical protein
MWNDRRNDMNPDGKPSKQQVRDWLRTRWMLAMPLPDLEALRREIGWTPIPSAPPVAGNSGAPLAVTARGECELRY